jgi:hypothetical protein
VRRLSWSWSWSRKSKVRCRLLGFSEVLECRELMWSLLQHDIHAMLLPTLQESRSALSPTYKVRLALDAHAADCSLT